MVLSHHSPEDSSIAPPPTYEQQWRIDLVSLACVHINPETRAPQPATAPAEACDMLRTTYGTNINFITSQTLEASATAKPKKRKFGQTNMAQLAEFNACRSARAASKLSLEENEGVTLSTPAANTPLVDLFTNINNTPTEIRMMICRAAFSDPQLIEIVYDSVTDVSSTRAPKPITLSTSSLFRKETLKHYHLFDSSARAEHRIYFSPQRDTLYLGLGTLKYAREPPFKLWGRISTQDLSRIQNLAIDLDLATSTVTLDGVENSYLGALMKATTSGEGREKSLSNLRNLTFIMGHHTTSYDYRLTNNAASSPADTMLTRSPIDKRQYDAWTIDHPLGNSTASVKKWTAPESNAGYSNWQRYFTHMWRNLEKFPPCAYYNFELQTIRFVDSRRLLSDQIFGRVARYVASTIYSLTTLCIYELNDHHRRYLSIRRHLQYSLQVCLNRTARRILGPEATTIFHWEFYYFNKEVKCVCPCSQDQEHGSHHYSKDRRETAEAVDFKLLSHILNVFVHVQKLYTEAELQAANMHETLREAATDGAWWPIEKFQI